MKLLKFSSFQDVKSNKQQPNISENFLFNRLRNNIRLSDDVKKTKFSTGYKTWHKPVSMHIFPFSDNVEKDFHWVAISKKKIGKFHLLNHQFLQLEITYQTQKYYFLRDKGNYESISKEQQKLMFNKSFREGNNEFYRIHTEAKRNFA